MLPKIYTVACLEEQCKYETEKTFLNVFDIKFGTFYKALCI